MLLSLPLIVVLMLTGYALVMAFLAVGLRVRRPRQARLQAIGPRRGWPGLLRQVAGTVTGGWLLLLAVVLVYYYGVAGLGRGFLRQYLVGTAQLLGIALPLYLAASWLTTRRRGPGRRGDGRW